MLSLYVVTCLKLLNWIKLNWNITSTPLYPFYRPLVIRCLLEFYLLLIVATLFNRDLNRGCLVFMFSLRFSRSKFLINYGGNFVYVKFFRVRKIFRTQVLAGFAVFSFKCLKLLIPLWVIYYLGCSLIEDCSLTGC